VAKRRKVVLPHEGVLGELQVRVKRIMSTLGQDSTIRESEFYVWCPLCGKRQRYRSSEVGAIRANKRSGVCSDCVPLWRIRQREQRYHMRGDETTAIGSVIHWGEMEGHLDYSKDRVPVTCGICGEKRIINRNYIRSVSFKSGRCNHCRATATGEGHPRWNGGRRYNRQGYITVAVSSLPPDLQPLVREMQRMNGGEHPHVIEHRALMCGYLGRPLRADEYVHHKDLSVDGNVRSNLQLLTPHTHIAEHVRIVRAFQQELMRLYNLLDEHDISHRKQLLRHLPWEYQEQIRQNYGA
jgi:hypothetical protein